MSLCDGAAELRDSYIFPNQENGQNNSRGRNTSDIEESVFSHWCRYEPVSTLAHYIVGSLLIFVCVASIAGNALVVIVFTNLFFRYRRLRSAANIMIINLAISDMLNGCIHPMVIYSSFKEIWMFGKTGCELYAALCGLFGLVSIVTLAAIATERCIVISMKPWLEEIQIMTSKIKYVIAFIWLYCAATVAPPLLGWGAFVPEGFLTSCSFDYLTRSFANRAYFLYIFILGFFLPVTFIIICYGFIIRTIFQNERDIKKNNVNKFFTKNKRTRLRKRNDYKAAEMIMLVIGMFFISWTPYSVIAIIGQFGNPDDLTPWVSVLPSLFAKMSTIYNPAIYGLSHRHFRATLRRLIQRTNSSKSTGKAISKFNLAAKRYTCCLSSGGSVALKGSMPSCSESQCCMRTSKPQLYRYQVSRKQSGSMFAEMQAETLDIKEKSEVREKQGLESVVMSAEKSIHGNNLLRSLLFRSDSSLYQKYQTVIRQDQYAKVSIGIYMCDGLHSGAVIKANDQNQNFQLDAPARCSVFSHASLQ